VKQKTPIQDIITKFREVHGNRYEYAIETYVNMKTPMTMICKDHGEFTRTPSDHIRLKHGCRKCGWEETGKAKRISWETFLEKSNTLHDNKYECIQPEEFTGYDCLIDIRCPTHGEFKQKVKYHIMGSGCPACGRMKSGYKVETSSNNNRGMYTLEEYISIIPDEHRNKHDYSKSIYLGKEHKIEIGCKEHGEFFSQMPDKHRAGHTGCSVCIRNSKKKMIPYQKIFERCTKKHGNSFTYDETSYNGSLTPLKYTCLNCGAVNERTIYAHASAGIACTFCGGATAESQIAKFLQDLNVNFVKNRRSILPDGKELDFYLPDHNIAIEHNGTYYHSELGNNKGSDYHITKTNMCNEKGIQLLHIFEDEWRFKQDICKSIIANKLGKSERIIYARKCIIKEIDYTIKNTFLNENHIQGADRTRIKYGLYHNEELVSVMTFGSPTRIAEEEWELTRFCNKQNTSVVGAASKLLTHFIREHNPNSIVSYADRRWSNGGLYYTLGFTLTTPRNYKGEYLYRPQSYYLNKSNYIIREHRSNYTKDKIAIKFPNIYDESLKEWDMMKLANYDRIWDSGIMKFIWTKK